MKKTYKILLWIILIGIWQTQGWGQGWEKEFDYSGSDRGYRILQTPDEGFLIAGFIGVGVQSKAALIKTNAEGDTLWTKKFDPINNRSLLHTLYETNNQEYITSGAWNLVGGNKKVFIARTDINGNEKWMKIFDFQPDIFGHDILELPNGDIVAAGTSINSENAPTDEDIYIIKMDSQGDTIWTKSIEDTERSNLIYSIAPHSDGGILLMGYTYPMGNISLGVDLLLIKVNENGDIEWEKTLDYGFQDFAVKILPFGNDEFIGLNFSIPVRLIKFNAEGDTLSTKILSEVPISSAYAGYMIQTDADKFAITGRKSGFGFSEMFLAEVDTAGTVLWQESYGNQIDYYEGYAVAKTFDKGFILAGERNKNSNNRNIYLVKTDSLGNSLTNYISGNVFYDSLENCLINPNEIPLTNWIVTAENEQNTYYSVTDEAGNYFIQTDTGIYTINLTIPNAYWQPCWNDSVITMSNFFDTLQVDFPVQAAYDCPILNVDISTPFLRRCYDNTYYVSYCNEGTVLAENAHIEIYFDEALIINSSTVPWSDQNGTTYTFPIGDVEVGECAGFQVNVTVDCDNTELGETHCVSAHIFPDSICLPPNTLWDGSTIRVEGKCENDSIEFKIKNIGDSDMFLPGQYVIIEDQVLYLNGTFQLPANDSLLVGVEATGATYRMEAEQAPFHPTNSAPSVTIEGCNNGQPISFGFVNAYSEDDADPFISRDCQQNIGAFDPNDKRGFPTGIGADHIIFHDTELEYLIRFQNTGTDTAFKVVIRDTLSQFLNPTSVKPGASSHPYTWELQNGNALKFTFDQIMLPDSNINEPASHGFVKFKIAQEADNLPGTLIHNSAAIYFDFNEPVITNTTDHLIEDRPFLSDTLILTFCDSLFYEMDTTILTTSNQLSWDISTTNLIQLHDPYYLNIDTSIMIGELFQGIAYEMDSVIIQNFISTVGCDSIITINLQVMPSAINNLNTVLNNIQLFPNPATNQINLEIELKEVTTLNITMINTVGLEINTPISNQIFNTGKHQLPIPIYDLPDGIYWIKISNGEEFSLLKLLKHKH